MGANDVHSTLPRDRDLVKSKKSLSRFGLGSREASGKHIDFDS